MLRRTFVHLPRVGYQTERRLWAQGLCGWETALTCAGPVAGFSGARWDMLRRELEESARSLERRDHRFFARCLASRDHWRACPEFAGRIGYLDIETTGMGAGAEVTVVGLYDGRRTLSFVAGDNLEALPEAVEACAMLVTFNGASFDLPFLRRRFRDFPREILHADLRPLLGQLGLRGGLKRIERELGMGRAGELEDLSGEDAVRLWQEYRRGDEAALELLMRYNAADVENLEPLLRLAYRRLWAQTGHTGEGAADERGD